MAMFCLLACLPLRGYSAPVPSFRHLLTDEASRLQDNISAVNAIAQDQQGFIWVGGENGLARYDGHQFVFFHGGTPGSGALCGNYVLSMVVDYTGALWIGTQQGLNRYLPATEAFECFLNDPTLSTSLADNYVRALAVDANNRLLVGTARGLDVFDPASRTFAHLRTQPMALPPIRSLEVDSRHRVWIGTAENGLFRLDDIPADTRNTLVSLEHYGAERLIHPSVSAIAEDRQGRLWVGTAAGISRIEADLSSITHYPPQKNSNGVASKARVQDIAVDLNGVVWVATDREGLFIFQEDDNQFVAVGLQQDRNRSLSSNNTRIIFNDRDGDIWVGLFPRGVNYFNRATEHIRNYIHQPGQTNGLRTRAVESLFEDDKQLIWLGGYTGVSIFDPQLQSFRHLTSDDAPVEGVISLAQAPDGDMWMGTWSAGLYRYSQQTGRFKQYLSAPQPSALGSDFIWHLLVDPQGRLWVGTEDGGLNLYEPASDSFRHFVHQADNPKTISNNFVWNMVVADAEHLWLATSGGLNYFNTKTFEVEPFKPGLEKNYGLKSQFLVELMVHSNGDLWIGTQDQGIAILNARTGALKTITTQDGLAAAYVSSLVEDDEHNVWAATVSGISLLSADGTHIKNYDLNNGLVGNGYNRDTGLKDRSGGIYIGGTEGLNYFKPGELIVNRRAPNVLLTGCYVREQNWLKAGNQTPLQLSFEQNSLKFVYSAMSFRASQNNLYQTQLVGLETDWTAPIALNSVNYNNLLPGSYELHVRGANSDGTWSEQYLRVPFVIAPPPWRTTWAYCAYATLALFVLTMAILLHRRHLQLSNEQALNSKLNSLDKMKDAFLANTSQELRAPLNGIIGLAQSLLDGSVNQLDAQSRHTLNVIVASGRRLAHLVDDLLDSAKLMGQQLELEKTPINLYSLVSHVSSLLQPMAAQKNLLLLNQVAKSTPAVLADEARIQQVLMNLVTNAIKYTEKGRIDIIAQISEQEIAISVSDTGVGINLVDLKTIFQPFSQVMDNNTHKSRGPGLGLSICQQLVELHGGRLTVSSEVGQGSIFKFTLPRVEGGLVSKKINSSKMDEPLPMLDTYIAEHKTTNHHHLRKILMVDDDHVSRLVVSKMLAAEPFTLIEASSGEEALVLLQADPAIDLILLDIMMPGLSGFTICQQIREQFNAAHLPIVLITSKDMPDDVVRGFSSGASGYIIKPINKAYIVKLIYQQLAWVDNSPLLESATIEMYELFRSLILTYSPGQTPIDRMAELLVAFKQGFRLTKVLGIWRLRQQQFETLYSDPACPVKPIHGSNRVRKLTQLVKALDQQRLLTPLNEGDLETLADYLPAQTIKEWVMVPLVYEGHCLGAIAVGAQEAWPKHDLTLFTEAKPFCVAALLPLLADRV
ncbi:MAG: two-component regulator propeller domain-containing protein [Marinagarivorans sp.]